MASKSPSKKAKKAVIPLNADAHPGDAVSSVALSKVKPDAEAREELKPGIYAVDTTVRIRGELHVATDHEVDQVNKVNPFSLLALALSKVNDVTAESLLKEAAEMSKNDLEMDTKALEKKVKDAWAKLASTTRQTRKGAVSLKETDISYITNQPNVLDGIEVAAGS